MAAETDVASQQQVCVESPVLLCLSAGIDSGLACFPSSSEQVNLHQVQRRCQNGIKRTWPCFLQYGNDSAMHSAVSHPIKQAVLFSFNQ